MEPWLQLLGRLHPLVLHLPIGALVLLAIAELWARCHHRPGLEKGLSSFLCAVIALGVLISALSGWFLSEEFESAGDTFWWHRALGIALTVVVVCAALAVRFDRQKLYGICLTIGLLLLVPVGHFGAEMTHGAGFLSEPFEPQEQTRPAVIEPIVEDSFVAQAAPNASYATVIAPILEAYCTKCHGPEKQKGGLALHAPESILRPSESGLALITPGDPTQSELIRRIRLPLDNDDHMPPPSKRQPSSEEIEALEAWIRASGPFESSFEHDYVAPQREELSVPNQSLAPQDSQSSVQSESTQTRNQPSASAISVLTAKNVHVEVIDPVERLLWIDFRMLPSTDDAMIALHLPALSEFILELNFAGTKITDDSMVLVRQMPKLERLDLTSTSCSDAGLANLEGHPTLRSLNLTSTQVGGEVVKYLTTLPALERVHLWNSRVTQAHVRALSSARPELQIEDGSISPAPIIDSEPVDIAASLAPDNSLCPITGNPVQDAYRIVKDQRVIGFCSAACAASSLK